MMNSFNLKRQFNQFKAVTHNLKLCRILHDHLATKKQVEKRKFIFESWIETAFSYRRASRFRRVQLLGKAISNIIQGIANTKYLDKCERNGEVLRNQSLKRGFLQFLQESTLYLRSRRHHLQALKEQFNQSRLHKLFMGFLMYRIANLKHKSMLALAKEDHNRNLKKKLLLSLKRNMTVSRWLHSKLDAYMTKLKAEGFTFLRYSSAKQKALRDRYYDHVVSQSRTLALGCLQLWQNKCTEKMERRAMFAEKTVIFSKKRFFFAMRSKISRKQKSLMKVGLFINYTQKCLLSKVISALCDRTFSEEGQQRKRARIYARIKTISKVLRGLFQNAKIQRTYKQITMGKLQKQRLQFFNIWHSAFLSTQVNKEALVLQMSRRVKSMFRAWHLTAAAQRRERNMIFHARKIYVHKWLRKGIIALKENVVKNQVYYELSPQKEKLAHLQKQGALFSAFQKTCVKETKIRKAFNSVNRRQLKKTYSKYLTIMKQQYHLSVGFKRYATLKPLQIKKKVFSFFKAKLRQRQQEQRYQLQAEKHENKVVQRNAFGVLKDYMNNRRNTKAMKQIAEKVYLTKAVIGRAYAALKGYWEVKRYLANQEQAFKQQTVKKCQNFLRIFLFNYQIIWDSKKLYCSANNLKFSTFSNRSTKHLAFSLQQKSTTSARPIQDSNRSQSFKNL